MKSKLLIAALAMAISSPAHAWNDKGHMTVAAVAWSQMTPKARDEASRLLKLNPHYARWIINVVPADRDRTAFMRAATWPDKIRGEYDDEGFEPIDPPASWNKGYSDRHVHSYWHYKNIPFSPDGTAIEQPSAINAVSRIKLFAETIGNPGASDDVKSYDLSWLIHLVGDIHQPLHASERFTEVTRRGDNGGNSVKVCTTRVSVCGEGGSLHSFWDGAIGNGRTIKAALTSAQRLPATDPDEVAIQDPDDWASESFDLSKRYAYAAPIGVGRKPFSLTGGYEINAGSIAEKRISLAGARLARKLNDLWR